MYLSLRYKIVIGILGLLILTVVSVDYSVENIISGYLDREFNKRAVFSGIGVSERAVDYLTEKDISGLQMELLGYLRERPDVKYIFIRSPHARTVIASTPDLPAEVKLLPPESPEEPYHLQKITIGQDSIVDVSVPIEDGAQGYVHLGMSEMSLLDTMGQATRVIVTVSCGIILLGGGLAALMVRVLTKPIPELVRVSEAVGKGDLEQTVSVSTTDEIGVLGKSINDMIKGLKTARGELLSAKDYTDQIIRSMGDVLVVLGTDAKIKIVSASGETVFGYAVEELKGISIGMIYMDGESAFRSDVLDKVARGDKIQDFLFTGRTSDTRSLPMSLSASPMRDAEGQMTGLVCIMRDRTEVENLLYEIDQIYNGSLSAMRVVDEKLNIISANNAFCEMVGVPKDQIKGKKCYELFRSDYCRTERCNLLQIFRGQSRLDMEDERRGPDGRKIQVRVLTTPFLDSTGKTSGIIEVFSNISEQKKLIGELQHKSEELEEAYETQRTYATIVTTLNSPAEFDVFLSNALNQIAGHTGAQAGVLYLLEPAGARLLPAASYALDKAQIKSFVMGEGLPGQAAQELRAISLRDVPKEYFNIASGMIEGLPRQVFCAPVQFGQQLIGVLELATCFEFTDNLINLLKIVANQLGVSIHEAQMHVKTEQLAEDLRDKNDLLAAQNEELRSQSDELVAMNEELHSQTEELANQKRDLEEKTRQAREADKLKSEFLSNMSHELRTPLNAILGMSALLGSTGSLNPRQESYLKIVERNGQNLLQLINDILDLSKIESGTVECVLSDIHIREFLEDTAMTIGTLAQEKKINLNVMVDSDVGSIVSDSDRLRQILTNLLSNAIKFTDEGGAVSIKAKTNGPGYIDVSVSDTGIGIRRESLPSVFEAFRQLDGTATRRHGGIGLGLSIVKKLTSILDGKISVESDIGHGSTFTLTLPRKSKLGEARVPSIDSKIEEVRRAFYPQIHEESRGPANLMIIDDDPLASREIGIILRDENFNVKFAASGREGLAKIKEAKPDLVLLDLKMPGMDGFSVVAEISKDKALADVPLILITAMDLSPSDRKELERMNVQDVILKGQDDTQAFLKKIKTVLSRKTAFPKIADKAQVKILVVEDQPDNLFLLQEAIRPAGYTIITAVNGEEAIEVAQREDPDIILMDIQMPVMDGYEAIRRMRAIPALINVPTIALTARAMRGEDKKAISEGYDDYLAKPVSPLKVVQKIEEWLEKRYRFKEPLK